MTRSEIGGPDMADARHHHAVRVIYVEVPVAGSPEPLRRSPPPAYSRNPPTHWRPQRTIPSRPAPAKSQAGLRRLVDIMRDLDRREALARRMLTPNAAILKAWLSAA